MRARAPGKLVLSGAYAVLEGAPAIVTAVDRYCVADASKEASFVPDEVQAALDAGAIDRAPSFDVSGLRHEGRKLGLGSSAAIVVACIAAAQGRDDADAIFPVALAAHRAAQGGGSGIDVAAACYGGSSVCRLDGDRRLGVKAFTLPRGLAASVWGSPSAASTRAMLARLRDYARAAPSDYEREMAALSNASGDALGAATVPQWLDAVGRQFDTFVRLGTAADIPIVTDAMAELDRAAAEEGARFGPSGAGGGDVSLFYGERPPSPRWCALAREKRLFSVPLALDAPGVSLRS